MANTRFQVENGLFVSNSGGSANVVIDVPTRLGTTLEVDGATQLDSGLHVTSGTTQLDGQATLNDQLTVQTNAFKVNASGNIGIGTASGLNDKLTILGSANVSSQLKVHNTFSLSVPASQGTVFTAKWANGDNAISITDDGAGDNSNVYFRGNTYWSGDLHVVDGTFYVSENFVVQGDQITTGNELYAANLIASAGTLWLGGSQYANNYLDFSSYYPWNLNASDIVVYGDIFAAGDSGIRDVGNTTNTFNFYGNTVSVSGPFTVQSTAIVVNESNARVGIGGSPDATKVLKVTGSANITTNLDVDGTFDVASSTTLSTTTVSGLLTVENSSPALLIKDDAAGSGVAADPKIRFANSSADMGDIGYLSATHNDLYIRNLSDTNIRFENNNNEYMRLQNDGDLSISERLLVGGAVTGSPDATLQVVGTANVSGAVAIGGVLTGYNDLVVRTNKLQVTTNGVGIGMTPGAGGYPLQVTGTSLVNSIIPSTNNFVLGSTTNLWQTVYANTAVIGQSSGTGYAGQKLTIYANTAATASNTNLQTIDFVANNAGSLTAMKYHSGLYTRAVQGGTFNGTATNYLWLVGNKIETVVGSGTEAAWVGRGLEVLAKNVGTSSAEKVNQLVGAHISAEVTNTMNTNELLGTYSLAQTWTESNTTLISAGTFIGIDRTNTNKVSGDVYGLRSRVNKIGAGTATDITGVESIIQYNLGNTTNTYLYYGTLNKSSGNITGTAYGIYLTGSVTDNYITGNLEITGDLLPSATNTKSLGSSANTWNTAYIKTLTLTNDLSVTHGGTGLSTATQYGIIYGNATSAFGVTAAGTSGQILKSNGTSAPTWIDQSGLGVDFASLTNKLSGTNDYSTDGDLISGRGSGGAALTINDGYGNANITWNHQNGTPEQNGNAGRISVNTDGVHVAYDWSNPTTHSANLAYMSFELKSAVPNGVAGNTPEAMVLKEDQLNLGSYNTKLIANDYEPTANNTGSIGTTYLRYDTAFVDDLTVTNTVSAATGTFTTLTTSDLTASTTTKVTNLNADLLDSISSGSFLRSDADDVFGATGGTYIRFDDDKELRFGTGSDFKIYHNGTDSVISHQSNVADNDLLIRSIQDVFIQSGNGSTGYENAIQAINNGAVTLFHSGSSRLTTTGDGVDVTGDFSASGKLLSETGGTNGTNTKKLSLYLSGVNDTGTAAHAMKSYYAPQGSTLSSSVGRYGYVSVVEQNSTFNNTSHTNLNMHGIWSQVQGGFGAYEPNLARAGHFETINRAGTLDNSGHTTSPYDGIFEGIYAKATIDSSSPYYLNAVRGAWIEAEYSGDNVSENVQAIRTKAYTNNPIGGVTDLQNIYAQSQIDSSSSVLGTFRGANFQMVNNGSVSGDSSGVLVSYSGSGSYSANMFGLYANMGSVTPTGTKYGLYIDNETTNYLSGNLQVDGIMYAQHAPTTTNTGHTHGQLIDTDATVSGTFGANYRNAGLYIDVDSSGTPTANATTGRFSSMGSYITNNTTAQNSYYSYGINVLNYHSGALTAGASNKALHYGAYIQGQSDIASGYVNVLYGIDTRSYAGSNGSAITATYDNIYGIFSQAYKYDNVTTGTDGFMIGAYGQIGMDTNAGYIASGASLYSYIDTTSTALRNSYGFYNNMGQRRTGTYTGYNTMGVYVNWGGNVSGSTKYSWYSDGGANVISYFQGQIQATADITAYYSDERLKTNLGNITNALDKVKSLNGFYYRPNALGQSFGYKDEMHVGVSAQQVEKILPEVVQLAPFDCAKEYVDGKPVSESGENYKTVQYDKLVPLLIEAIKEQDEKINRLESMVEQLLNKKEML